MSYLGIVAVDCCFSMTGCPKMVGSRAPQSISDSRLCIDETRQGNNIAHPLLPPQFPNLLL
uniref:Uncharacterized protein n=1 Tax=Arundo donax TaxID=35708 RepID=A0A0A9TIK0_ARUDO